MFGKSVQLFTLFGFKVKVDFSWTFLALLIAWSLAQGYFPGIYSGLPPATYWWMGIAGTIGLFFSIVFHEMAHSIVARRYGLPIRGITLFLFGGVAEMEEEPQSAKAEFLMAIAGPIASVVLAGLFYGASVLLVQLGQTEAVIGVFRYLGFLNALLAGFNLVPAFPLDGGRVLRAFLWHWFGDMSRATKIAARSGSLFGLVLIGYGVITAASGGLTVGIWYVLIGLFLRGAADSSYRRVIMKQALAGEPVSRFMTPNPITVPPDITLRQFVDDWVYRYYHEMFPVVEAGHLRGCLTINRLKGIDHEHWDRTKVGDVMLGCRDETAIDADEDAMIALSRMQKYARSRMMVTRQGELVGVVALKDLMRLVALRLELEES